MNLRTLTTKVAATLVLAVTSSCFTGIDSTPAIKPPKEDDTGKPGRAEETYLSDITPAPPRQWKAGLTAWKITDAMFGMLFTPEIDDARLKGSVAVFAGMEPALSITGDTVTNIMMQLPGNRLHSWTVNRSPSAVKALDKLTPPYSIDLGMVNQARRHLQGRQLWVITRDWRDSLDRPLGGSPFPKFIPVTINEVAPGTELYPIRVGFSRPDGEGNAYLFLSPDDDVYTRRTFAGQWRLTDPRLEYKRISDDDWALIVEGKTAPGMTYDLVRLSLGSPERIDRQTNGATLVQVWRYSSGKTLRFEDGLLVDD